MSGEQKSDQQQANQQREAETIPFQFPTSEHHPAAPLHEQFPPPQPATGAPVTPAAGADEASAESADPADMATAATAASSRSRTASAGSPAAAAPNEPIHFPTSTPAPDRQPDAPDGNRAKAHVQGPEELTEEQLRLMADSMPGEGPGDD